MKNCIITLNPTGPGFIDFTTQVKETLKNWLKEIPSGQLNLFCQHTSCALTINEAYDPAASRDMERFLDHLAPQNLSFIEHKDEGPDDSPSHMKALITGHSLTIPVIEKEMALGRWQGIYLCEFRDHPSPRKIVLSYR